MKSPEELGNPIDDGKELATIHPQEVVENEIVSFLLNLADCGQDHYGQLVPQTLEHLIFPISKTLNYENALTFANRTNPNKKAGTISAIQKKFFPYYEAVTVQSRPRAKWKSFFCCCCYRTKKSKVYQTQDPLGLAKICFRH